MIWETPLRTRLLREQNRAYKITLRLLWRLYGIHSPLVFLAHDVGTSEQSLSSFKLLLQYLADNNWHAMTEDELLNGKWAKKSFYFTFDDIPDSVYTIALPVLKEYNVPFTAFITKDLIDKTGYITTPHLKALANESLCRLGGHGIDHVVFRHLSDEETLCQCLGVKEWIQSNLGTDYSTFAFPYGGTIEVSQSNRRISHQAGHLMSFSTFEGTLLSSWFTGKYFLPRVNVSERFVEKFTAGKFPNFKDCEG